MTAQPALAHPAAATGQCPVARGGSAENGAASAHHGYAPFAMTDPFPSYAALRENEPVMFDEEIGYFVVSRYDDVKATFDNWQVFSSENAQAPVRARGAAATTIMNDGGFTAYSGLSARIPPEHTRMRAIVQKEFTPRRYKKLEPTIRENTARLLQQMLAHPSERGDFLKDVAVDIPTITILGLLGVGPEMVSTYKKWSDSRAAMTWGDLSDDEQIPHAHNLVDYWTECLRLVSNAHEQLDKNENGDNLVFDLVQAQSIGSEISDHEIASVCYSLLFAGHETTTTLISNTIRELLAHPAEWQKLLEDPSRIPAAIDETLRFSPSIVGWRRKALVDTEIGGVAIPAGSNILLLMGSANRDGDTFEQPETFDINRVNARNHLSFGFGIHYCLGNMLAKMQDKIVVEETLKAAPGLRLIDAEKIVFGDNLSFRAPTAVPVTWGDQK
ncbi:cytochrome P450 [Cryobacterium sp. PH31-O1]|uniref:cytochrome P450 n=1 Tax=Cryobacterium sp. PH31-O1 TaxID=3046306 RepID=UPI0024B9AC44|nr:cytochrome P450 [Cryobacterium sp. PH31-O1]MDJ0339876.1 cytochrome P450 [Cryobacterium sp. PH31-O1]